MNAAEAGAAAAAAAPTSAAEQAYKRGLEHAGARRWAEAAAEYEAAAGAAPHDVVYWLNLAHARLRLGELGRGAGAAARALVLDPGSELALQLAVQCLGAAGRHGELAALFDAANMDAVADADLHLERGMALTRLGRFQDAIKAFFSVLRRKPRCAEAFAQLGNVFQLMKMPEEARESFRNALALGRTPVEMASAAVFTSLEAARWESIDADLAALDALADAGGGEPVPFYSLAFGRTRQQQLAAARRYARRVFRASAPMPARGARSAGGRIRVGYVSSDLHEHATAYLIAEVFERHDPGRFRAHAYSYGNDDGSPMRRRIERAFGPDFVDARTMTTQALAERIRADAIDVLFDLKGYTLYARNEVFGLRAAPIQVNFLGFPGSLGSTHYDYVIGDPIVTPLEHADGFDEKIAQMPCCYQPNDRRRPAAGPAMRARWNVPQEAFVFCCFNANYKITAAVFDRWCALLRQVDDAVLWLFESNPQARRNLCEHARRRGVAPERLLWASSASLGEHIARIRAADLFLDTAPVNAHTTASDALWAGVPLVTALGQSFVARVAASLLHAAGLAQLVARDLDDYERIALALARDRGRLRALRTRLDEGRMHCALFDSARYTRDLEALIERMVERHDAGLPPAHLQAAK